MRRLVGLAVIAAVAAGCGGGSDPPAAVSTGGSNGLLTKSEWIAAADDICAEAKRKAANLPTPDTAEALATQLDDLIRIFEAEQASLRKLSAAPAEQARVDAVVEAAGVQVTLARGLQEAAKAGDLAAIQTYTQEHQPEVAAAQKVAQDYGLKVCGNGT